jgi:type II secretory pathway component GspD/PulD (secretin)
MKKILLLVSLSLLLTQHCAAHELTVISLQHRSAEEVLPMIRSFLDQDEVAQGMNYQLIVRASAQHLEQVKQMLVSLDSAPRRLKITVMQDVDRATIASLNELSGSIGIGNGGQINVPNSPANADAEVQINHNGDQFRARIKRENEQLRDHKKQQVQVLDGGRARINVAQSVAVPQQQMIHRPWGWEVVEQTQFQSAGSGFYVQPRVQGDRVTVIISTENDELDVDAGHTPRTSVQHASSTLSGRLGEWLELAGMSQQQEQSEGSLLSRSNSQTSETRNIFFKVEDVTP